MTGADGGPAVLDEASEIRLVAAVTEVGLGEGDVGDLEVFRPLGEAQGSLPEDAGECEIAFGAGPGARGG